MRSFIHWGVVLREWAVVCNRRSLHDSDGVLNRDRGRERERERERGKGVSTFQQPVTEQRTARQTDPERNHDHPKPGISLWLSPNTHWHLSPPVSPSRPRFLHAGEADSHPSLNGLKPQKWAEPAETDGVDFFFSPAARPTSVRPKLNSHRAVSCEIRRRLSSRRLPHLSLSVADSFLLLSGWVRLFNSPFLHASHAKRFLFGGGGFFKTQISRV